MTADSSEQKSDPASEGVIFQINLYTDKNNLLILTRLFMNLGMKD